MENSKHIERRTGYFFLLIFVLLAAGIFTGAYFAYHNYEKNYRAEIENQLSAVAGLKVNQLVQWRKERLEDGQVFYKNDVFSAMVKRYIQNKNDRDAKTGILTWVGQVQRAYNYDLMMLLDAHLNTIVVFPENKERARLVIDQRNTEMLTSGNIAFQDFYRNDQDQHIYLKILVPILENRFPKRLIAVLALRISPEEYLYPLIKKWPTPTRTSETLIIRRDGNDALFLNDLKFHKDAALNLRIPLESKDVPAVRAALGQTGIVEGIDYRGVPVIADVRAVPDSPWFLVARMDMEEVYAPLKERLWLMIILVGALLGGAGASVGFVWRQQRSRFYQEQYESVEALRNSETRYRRLFEAARDGILILDAETGMITDVNPFLIEMLGYTHEQFLGKKLWELGFLKDIITNEEKFLDLRQKEYVRYDDLPLETSDRRRIDVEFVSNVYLVDHHKVIQCNIRDITERKRAEDALVQEKAFSDKLLNAPQDTVFLFEPATGKPIRWNKRFAEVSGYNDEEIIGMKAPDDFYSEEDLKKAKESMVKIIAEGHGVVEMSLITKQGAHIPFEYVATVVETVDGKKIFLSIGRDITERKLAGAYGELGREILQILNEPGDIQDSLQRVLAALKTRTGFDAVGIRLQDGEDFPYFTQEGFSKDFLLTENTLIERGPDGGVCRDKNGNVNLECTCGLVISGKTDPANPLFTPGGSCWINDSFPLLDIPPGEDPRYHPRNRCIHKGYASVALVPIRNKERIVGLIQFNDRRKGRFTLNTIALLEGIASHIGVALMRKQAEKELQESMKERENLIRELQYALENIKTLQGLIPICSNCKKIRDDKGYWNQVEGYISKHTDAKFTHGICPDCSKELYGDLYEKAVEKQNKKNM